MRNVRSAAALLAVIGSASVAHALQDRPLDAHKLALKRSPTKSSLVFVAKDPTFLFPPFGTDDDPATGTPGGATIELFSNAGTATIQIPAGVGTPGWTTKSGDHPQYRFKNASAPGGISVVKLAIVKNGKLLKVVSRDAGLALTGPQGAVGIRITMGELRNCARFDAATIRKDEAGNFRASHASAATLADCSDNALLGLPPPDSCELAAFPACGGTCPGNGVCTGGLGSCTCVSPSSECGLTSPVCNGPCPAGEDCLAFGPGPVPNCGCFPTGTTPCGDPAAPGPPICGGDCPQGIGVCRTVFTLAVFGGQPTCACGAPQPCGPGGIECPSGFGCALIAPSTYVCAPIGCSDNPMFPTCGGTCVAGATCQPVTVSSFSTCTCAVASPCDAGCGGGLTCAAGEVCHVNAATAPACGCATP